MFRTFLSLVMVALLVIGLDAAPAFAGQASGNTQAVEKVKEKVAKMGLGAKARVTVRTRDGKKIKGFISQAGANNFTVRDRNSGEPTTFAYADVLKVEDN